MTQQAISTLRHALAHRGVSVVVVPTAADVVDYRRELTRLLAGRPVHDQLKKHGDMTVKLEGLELHITASDRDAWVKLDGKTAFVILEREEEYAPRDRAAWRKWAKKAAA